MLTYERIVAEIDLNKAASNMRHIRSHVPPHSKIMAIVKADGYGHGAAALSHVLLANGADCLGVAICDEGVALRESDITSPILVLGYTSPDQYADLLHNGLTQTVFSYDMAVALSAACARANKTLDIHIKIDTGMGRLGFLPTETSMEDVLRISKLPHLTITGVYSHLSDADGIDKSFAHEQYERFVTFVEALKQNIPDDFIVHIANSAAILDLPSFGFDMVRPGIILYGLYPSAEVNRSIALQPCMTLKTMISNIKEVDKGTTIGYGRSHVTNRRTIVATIPVGYADGYRRQLGNRGHILVGGQFAPIIGRVCMDQFMADVTDIPSVGVGDEVVLMGRQGVNEISADDLATLEDTINYEVVCNVSRRVPRVYVYGQSTTSKIL